MHHVQFTHTPDLLIEVYVYRLSMKYLCRVYVNTPRICVIMWCQEKTHEKSCFVCLLSDIVTLNSRASFLDSHQNNCAHILTLIKAYLKSHKVSTLIEESPQGLLCEESAFLHKLQKIHKIVVKLVYVLICDVQSSLDCQFF